ncbi:phosphoribosyltransferase [uncultured Jatrophihabitans sp.]|uniref:phosphoribosyltransferase n=1 Tax=uncultured Jatrophihabitans sp. TaxID=1610747 RepID=UPI0035CA772D
MTSRSWVADTFGASLDGDVRLPELVSLGLRHNPRRAHLLVSTVLGKHVPADPRVIHRVGCELGAAVAQSLGGERAVVLGLAETATALGHCVAEQLAAPYLHSTRRHVATATAHAAFEEEHSHATAHRLLPADPRLLDDPDAVLVLVDDELSTGRTALNTIAALHARTPRRQYVLAALVDLRDEAARSVVAKTAAELGADIDVVSLARGTFTAPPGFGAHTAAAAAALPAPPSSAARSGQVLRHDAAWAAGVRESGRHGWVPADVAAARAAAEQVAARVRDALHGSSVLVLGTEELMYAPLLIGLALCEPSREVQMSSTTRSPVVVHDIDGYPVRSAVRFPAHDHPADGPAERFAYNIGDYSDIVLVVDEDADTARLRDGLVESLREHCSLVHVVVLPCERPLPPPLRGPDFGSYPPADVAWLLTDLSGVALEAPTEEREEAIQSGGAHYAQSLPVEYQPDAEYRALYDDALAASARRIAHAVGLVTELVLAERGPRPVLASLARAGTPVGVLMRRWAAFAHGHDLPHYTLSIVRGRGIDRTALRYLARNHNPADVVFVDGWTGKGAIVRELDAAITAVNAALGTRFVADLAVLADPGSCVRTFGTRADFLVPSACLNSTVSGLVSRTVLNEQVLKPGQFHGAKCYRELAGSDVSRAFVDTIAACFGAVAEHVARDLPAAHRADRTPTWTGWAQVEQLSERFGIGDVTLVKPGVGETTRVLLRRVPWAVLIRPDAVAELRHVLLLAQRRGVPVHEVADLTYSCVGLIHPRYTRGATGADGTAAR